MTISGREYFRLGAESNSSLGRVRKKRKKSVSTFGRFRLWTSFESSPVSVKRLNVEKIQFLFSRNPPQTQIVTFLLGCEYLGK